MLNFTHSFDITIFEIHLITSINILVNKRIPFKLLIFIWNSLSGRNSYGKYIYILSQNVLVCTKDITACYIVHTQKTKKLMYVKILISFSHQNSVLHFFANKMWFLWRDRTGILCYENYRRTSKYPATLRHYIYDIITYYNEQIEKTSKNFITTQIKDVNITDTLFITNLATIFHYSLNTKCFFFLLFLKNRRIYPCIKSNVALKC